MRIAYCVDRTNALVIVGRVRTDPLFEVSFERAQLERFVAGELRPFVLAGDKALRDWPMMPGDLLQHRPTAQLWANLRNKRADRRPQTWAGWPLARVDYALVLATTGAPPASTLEVATFEVGEERPDVVAVLLRPLVKLEKLLDHELVHDGFMIGYESGSNLDSWVRVPGPKLWKKVGDGDDPGVVDGGQGAREREAPLPVQARAERPLHAERAGTGDDDRSRGGCRERRASVRADGVGSGAHVRAGDGAGGDAQGDARGDGAAHRDDDARDAGGADAAHGDARDAARDVRSADADLDPLSAILPPWVRARFEGQLVEGLRVRVIGPPGVHGIRIGDELDAVRCPEREASVWVRAPNGQGYRLNDGEWAPLVARRRARSLDDL